MSVTRLKLKMQKFANDITLNSAVACFIIDGNRFAPFADTDNAGEDETSTGKTASIAANTVLPPILKDLSTQLRGGMIKEAHIFLEKGFLTLRQLDVDVAIQDKKVIKKCLFAFLYTSSKMLTTFDQTIHLAYISDVMVDRTERVENPDGTSTLISVKGLESLLKEALEEQYNPGR